MNPKWAGRSEAPISCPVNSGFQHAFAVCGATSSVQASSSPGLHAANSRGPRGNLCSCPISMPSSKSAQLVLGQIDRTDTCWGRQVSRRLCVESCAKELSLFSGDP